MVGTTCLQIIASFKIIFVEINPDALHFQGRSLDIKNDDNYKLKAIKLR